MWDRSLHRIALLELIVTGSLIQRQDQIEAWNELLDLRWARRTGRQYELALADAHRGKIEDLLGKMWPGWRTIAAALTTNALPPTPRGLQQLEDLQRQATLAAPLPPQLNQRTAIAAVGPHSKAILSEQRRQALGAVDLTRDGIVRVRPHRGMRLRRGGATLDLEGHCTMLGEVALPERALQAGLELAGPAPAMVLLVENVGPYIDIPAPADWLVAHVPGWNTRTAELLLARLPAVPVLLFGDLDPAGVDIAAHLQSIHPPLRWVTFDLWRTLLPEYAQSGIWPEDQDLRHAPPLVHELARRGVWLEQERLVLDPNLVAELLAVAHPPSTA
jgi:hypothetical protein